MNIGETIKKLRKQKDMTQEQLADYLKISPQAVSRWEINSTLPDITLIPALANIFDVSADVLLGIDVTAKEKRIQEIRDNAIEYSRNGYKEKALEILREGLKEYPNSYRIMSDIIFNLWNGNRINMEGTEEDKKEVIYLGEKVLAECTDDDCRQWVIRPLCVVYSNIGEIEKAEKLALKMPHTQLSRNDLLSDIYTGDKKFKHIRQNIFDSIGGFIGYVTCNSNAATPLDDGNYPYTQAECIVLNKKIIEILNIIFDDGNYGYFNASLDWQHRKIALSSIKIGDYENAVENLRLASEYVIKLDEIEEKYNSEQEYTSLFLKGMKFGGDMIGDKRMMRASPSNNSMDLLEWIQEGSFEPILWREDFKKIKENLKKYAKKR